MLVLTMPDLERAFCETEGIVAELFARHQGVFGELEFNGNAADFIGGQ